MSPRLPTVRHILWTMPSLPTRRDISRRTVLASVPLVQISALAAAPPSVASAFTADQMRLIEAVVNRLIPPDELGPGAAEAGVPVYLARSFAGYLSGDRDLFSEGLAAIEAAGKGDGLIRGLRTRRATIFIAASQLRQQRASSAALPLFLSEC